MIDSGDAKDVVVKVIDTEPYYVSVYIGTLDAFLEKNPEYIKVEQYVEEHVEEDFTDYEELT